MPSLIVRNLEAPNLLTHLVGASIQFMFLICITISIAYRKDVGSRCIFPHTVLARVTLVSPDHSQYRLSQDSIVAHTATQHIGYKFPTGRRAARQVRKLRHHPIRRTVGLLRSVNFVAGRFGAQHSLRFAPSDGWHPKYVELEPLF